MRSIFIVLFSLLSLIQLSACGRDEHDHPKNISGKKLFDIHCASCHSPEGFGSILLGVPSNRDTKLLNVNIRKKLLHGSGKDSNMPVFETMSEQEAIKIVQYLRSLGKQ